MNFNFLRKELLLPTIFSVLAASFPIFSLTIRGWVSAILFIASFLAILLYFQRDMRGAENSKKGIHSLPSAPKIYFYLFCTTFFLPFLSVLLSQLLTGDWDVARFDGPSRYIFSLCIFLAIFRINNPIELLIQYSFPVAAIVTLIVLPYLPQTGWAVVAEGRLTNYFIDPLIFGQLALVFGVLSFLSININGTRSHLSTLIKIFGAVIGIYLSLRSGSRTGWPAIPILIFLWAMYFIKGSKFRALVIAMTVTLVVSFASYQASSTIRDKVDALSSELEMYKWNSVNEHTSIGARISFIRIGFYYFWMRPISGWGNETLAKNINDEELAAYASQETRDELVRVGFHNDFINNMVHFGLLGLISTIFIFVVPLLFFIYCIRKKIAVGYAQFGIAYILIQSASCLSYHVLDFKFMASFYALMISILMGIMMSKFKAHPAS